MIQSLELRARVLIGPRHQRSSDRCPMNVRWYKRELDANKNCSKSSNMGPVNRPKEPTHEHLPTAEHAYLNKKSRVELAGREANTKSLAETENSHARDWPQTFTFGANNSLQTSACSFRKALLRKRTGQRCGPSPAGRCLCPCKLHLPLMYTMVNFGVASTGSSTILRVGVSDWAKMSAQILLCCW